MENSITETFRNGTFLITGSTGFLGKILTEKLLRSCSVKNIAVLVRRKKGFSADQRIADGLKISLYDRLRKEKPEFMKHIKVIEGDLDKSIVYSSTDREWIIQNVNFIFHCAATVKFNDPLVSTAKINIYGTENLLTLATQMKNLKGFVHVSTAYSHCPRNEIMEQYYPSAVTADELNNIIDSADRLLSNDMNSVLENWPNTYTFTKAITENLILTNYSHLPISIFRPSIIGCTNSEPEPGWLDNMNGPSGIMSQFIMGLFRTLLIDMRKIGDVIPVDYTANALICVMWDTVNRPRHQDFNISNEKPKIYNYVSSPESPLLWGDFFGLFNEMCRQDPSMPSLWYISYTYFPHYWIVIILRLLLHRIPAAIMDVSLLISGKKAKMLNIFKKIESGNDLYYTFLTKEWKFDNSNIQELWSLLSQEDRKIFYHSFKGFDWKSYIQSYFNGIKKHILREDLCTKKLALSEFRKLYWLHNLCIVLTIFLVFIIFSIFIK